MTNNRLWTKDYVCVCAAMFFVVLNYYHLLVTLPIYLIQNLDGPKSQAGLIVTMFFIAAIVIRPFTGKWIEQYGVKRIFLIAITIYLTATLFYFVSTSVISLLILRMYHGIGFGMATTALGTIVANIVPNARKGEGMGYYGLAITLAMAVGPFAGLVSYQNWGANAMFMISVITVFIGTIAGLFIKLPKIEKAKDNQVTVKKAIHFKDFFERAAIPIALCGFFFALVYSTVVSFVSVYAEELHLSDVASYFFIVCSVALIISRPFTGRMYDKYGENIIMYPAIVCLTLGLIFLSMSHSVTLFLLSALFIGLGWGTIFPSSQTIAIQVSPPNRTGVATATFLTTLDVGMGTGSFVFGVIGAAIGYSSLYLYCGIISIFGVAVYYFLHGRSSKTLLQQKSA